MGLVSDLRVLSSLVRPRFKKEKDLGSRLNAFYGPQAGDYDSFRKRLLPGRDELLKSIPFPEGGVWVDLGAGTGSNLESISDIAPKLERIYLVDLCEPLLSVAEERVKRLGLQNTHCIRKDVREFQPDMKANVVTLSYSLTMMPQWSLVLEEMKKWLAHGAMVGVVDFFVSRSLESEGRVRHPWLTRKFWPLWFGWDCVFLNESHLPTLESHFQTVQLAQGRSAIPYFPLGRVPYYQFLGRFQSPSEE